MGSRSRPIVIVKTGEPVPNVLARRGEFARMIEETIGDAWSGPYDSFDARTDRPFDPARAAAFVITGSSANVPTREPWIVRTEAWLRDVAGAGVPVLGICFGHQLLGQALGGEVQKNPRGREIGTITVERIADDPVLAGLGSTFSANATHVDSVVRLPRDARVLARSSLESHQAVRFADRIWGVQFHPEIDADIMRGYVEARREILESERFEVDRLLESIRDTEARVVLRNFVSVVASI